jgi:hypothetical protein
MSAVAEIRALVVTRDTELTTTFTEISREFGIIAQRTSNNNGGVPEELGRSKYEALVIDFETIPQTVAIFASIRQSPANRNAVVFGVVGSAETRQRARDQGATFLLERPLQADGIRRVLQAAYGLMTSERRRCFRCAVEVPAQVVRASGEEVICKTINISSNGMAVSTPVAFDLGEKLQVSLALKDSGLPIHAQATVVWDDKHGKSGLSMESTSELMQRKLDSWLDDQFKPRE